MVLFSNSQRDHFKMVWVPKSLPSSGNSCMCLMGTMPDNGRHGSVQHRLTLSRGLYQGLHHTRPFLKSLTQHPYTCSSDTKKHKTVLVGYSAPVHLSAALRCKPANLPNTVGDTSPFFNWLSSHLWCNYSVKHSLVFKRSFGLFMLHVCPLDNFEIRLNCFT